MRGMIHQDVVKLNEPLGLRLRDQRLASNKKIDAKKNAEIKITTADVDGPSEILDSIPNFKAGE